jgi:predicted site-specific integrase-resolvase
MSNVERKHQRQKRAKETEAYDEFVPARTMSKMVGLKYQTAIKLAKDVGIKCFTTPSGQTRYSKESILSYINDNANIKEILPIEQKHNIVYCRVSTKKQDDDLQRQIARAKSDYPDYEIISDLGSGLNWQRKGLNTILEYTMQRNLGELVVFHRDRLSRFGFDLLKKIITLSGGKVTVTDNDETKYESRSSELAEDLMSIIHIYSCREMGRRRYKSKKNKVVSDSGSTEEAIELDPHGKDDLQ